MLMPLTSVAEVGRNIKCMPWAIRISAHTGLSRLCAKGPAAHC
jgi:hypothetical protein